MKSINALRKGYMMRSNFARFISRYKAIIITLLIVTILGTITGIFTASKYSSNISITNIPDSNFVRYISGDKSGFGIFLTYFINYSVVIFAIIFLNNSIVLNVINYLYMFILGYRLGFLVSALIMLYSFAGVINSIIIIVPIECCMLIILTLISSIAIRRYLTYRKYGCSVDNVNYPKIYILLYVIFVALLAIKCMLMPLINITIIVN